MASILHNEQMKAFYDRLKANGKNTIVAQIAVMKKLIIVAHSLYKSEEMYDNTLYKKTTGIPSE